MSDAAYAVLTRDSQKCFGNLYTDEEVLKQEGVTDFEKYCLVPGKSFLSFCIPRIFPQQMCRLMGAEWQKILCKSGVQNFQLKESFHEKCSNSQNL